MDPRAQFEQQEGSIASTPEAIEAEQSFLALYQRIQEYDAELAQELDIVIGQLARAYEYMGYAIAQVKRAETA